jgi:hypothetical protein
VVDPKKNNRKKEARGGGEVQGLTQKVEIESFVISFLKFSKPLINAYSDYSPYRLGTYLLHQILWPNPESGSPSCFRPNFYEYL